MKNPFSTGRNTQLIDAESRIRAVESFTIPQCASALHVPRLQRTVALAILRRIRYLRTGELSREAPR